MKLCSAFSDTVFHRFAHGIQHQSALSGGMQMTDDCLIWFSFTENEQESSFASYFAAFQNFQRELQPQLTLKVLKSLTAVIVELSTEKVSICMIS